LRAQVWTSTLRRTIQTASKLNYPKLTWKSLDELDAGVCDGMTYEEIAVHYPDDYAARDDDKYNYVSAFLLSALQFVRLMVTALSRRRILSRRGGSTGTRHDRAGTAKRHLAGLPSSCPSLPLRLFVGGEMLSVMG
jgi:hypothetical protein